MKLDRFKDMANSMNDKSEREATGALFTLALYTIPIWLPIVLWMKFQDYLEEKAQTPIAKIVKADLTYPDVFNRLKVEDPEYYQGKLALHLKDPKLHAHPSQPAYVEEDTNDGGYYEKSYMDLNENGYITKAEAAKWKKDKSILDEHNKLMQANYERFGHIEGYREVVQKMTAKTAHSVGLYATNYSENFKFLQNHYKDDLHGLRKLLIHGLMPYHHSNSKALLRSWGGSLDLTLPANQKQAKETQERNKRMAEFTAIRKETEQMLRGRL